jgi:hypothetical protein
MDGHIGHGIGVHAERDQWSRAVRMVKYLEVAGGILQLPVTNMTIPRLSQTHTISHCFPGEWWYMALTRSSASL